MKLLLYCTKAKPYLLDLRKLRLGFQCMPSDSIADLNGKIVAECDFEVDEIEYITKFNYKCFALDEWFVCKNNRDINLTKESHLTISEMASYFWNKLDSDTCGYAIHIKNLHIFDKPRELKDYKVVKTYKNGCSRTTLEKAPQNMMKVKEFKDATVKDYILISIRPEHLVNILNGKKTIEIRKKILSEMKE